MDRSAREEYPSVSMKNLLALLAFAVAPLLGCESVPPAAAPAGPVVAAAREPVVVVDGAKARELVQGGARLVDVRTPDEFAEKHIEGAESMPLNRLFEADMGPKDRPIVVYCKKGGRARLAANSLHDRGYVKVYNLGKMENWDK